MRYFRIVSFSGIEAHRDDADRGSLRLVEGCIPHGQGGLRSAPVWEKIGDINSYSQNTENQAHGADLDSGNSLVMLSRDSEVHDLAMFSDEHTEKDSAITDQYALLGKSSFTSSKGFFSPVGNRLLSIGDGSDEALFIGLGSPMSAKQVFPDLEQYHQEWARFPKCVMFLVGPNKTIYASGNPESPLTVYISEPAGLTNPDRDSPYSTEMTSQNPGRLSSVQLLMTNALKITALSIRGDQVVVHTDKGCQLLSAPKPDQAETGYRVEQAPSGVHSGAINNQVVQGETSKRFWLGHDKQIYKDESATRAPDGFTDNSDKDQASYKSKGAFEKELPQDLSQSFATHSHDGGMYWVFVESDEYKSFINNDAPGLVLDLRSSSTPDAPSQITDLNVESVTSELPSKVRLTVTSIKTEPPGVSLLNVISIESDILVPGFIDDLIAGAIDSDAPRSVNLSIDSILSDLPSEIDDLNLDSVESDAPGQPIFLPGETENLDVDSITAERPGRVFFTTLSIQQDKPGPPTNLIAAEKVDTTCEMMSPFVEVNGRDSQLDLYVTMIGLDIRARSFPIFWSTTSSRFPNTESKGRSNDGAWFPYGGVTVEAGNTWLNSPLTSKKTWIHWPKFKYIGLRSFDDWYDNGSNALRIWRPGIGRHAWEIKVESANEPSWKHVLSFSESRQCYVYAQSLGTISGLIWNMNTTHGPCQGWGVSRDYVDHFRQDRPYIGHEPKGFGVCTPTGYQSFLGFNAREDCS